MRRTVGGGGGRGGSFSPGEGPLHSCFARVSITTREKKKSSPSEVDQKAVVDKDVLEKGNMNVRGNDPTLCTPLAVQQRESAELADMSS